MSTERQVVLLPWHARQLGPTMVRRVREASKFTRWVGADLYVLIGADPSPQKVLSIQEQLLSTLGGDLTSVVIETEADEMVAATRKALERRKTDLVMLVAEPGKSHPAPWQRELVEKAAEPILLVHSRARIGPVTSILVPMKGAVSGRDSALDFGIQEAVKLRVPLDILHVTPEGGGDHSLIGETSDVFYHEYPHQLEGMIAEASPMSSVADREVIRRFIHVRGEETSEILHALAGCEDSLIVMQWDGSFAPGRSEKIKLVLRSSPCPLLLIKHTDEKASTLRIGDTEIAA